MPLHWADAQEFTPARPPMDAFAPSLPLARSYLSALRGVNSKSLALDLEWAHAAATESESSAEKQTKANSSSLSRNGWIIVESAHDTKAAPDSDELFTCSSELVDDAAADWRTRIHLAQSSRDALVEDDDDSDFMDDDFNYIPSDVLSVCSHAGRLRVRAARTRPMRSERRPRTRHTGYFQPASNSTLRLQMASANVCLRTNAPKATVPPQNLVPPPPPPPQTPDPLPQREPLHSNKKGNGEHRRARTDVQRSRGALDAATRSAMVHANSSAYRSVLVARAQRKVEIRREVAARAGSTPRHLRKTSVAPRPLPIKQSVVIVDEPSDPVAAARDVDLKARNHGFGRFRHQFYKKYGSNIESALPDKRVTAVRLCPIAEEVQKRFMHKMSQLRSADDDVQLVFHGTDANNFDSIYQRGLLVPGGSNGVKVVNGSSLGVAIYSALSASTSLGYTRGTSTMLVCAALTKGSGVTIRGDFVVLRHEERICPLFLLDFNTVGGCLTVKTPAWKETDDDGKIILPTTTTHGDIRAAYARALLRRFYSLQRDRCASRTLHTPQRIN